MSSPVVSARGLTRVYGEGEAAVHALRGVDLEVGGGEFLAITGASGSGKSTLLRLMIGNERVDGGDVFVGSLNGDGGGEKSLRAMSEKERDEYRKCIGVLFQSGALFNSMSVADNVALPLREHTDLPEETISIMVKIKLELVGLREHSEKMPSQLSGGMKKRVALAQTLIMDPEILLMDEPFSALDPLIRRDMQDLLVRL